MFGQESGDTIYYNSNWEKVCNDDYSFYRVIVQQETMYKTFDYWKTGEIQMTGIFKSMNPDIRHGVFKWYHKNGKQKRTTNYKNNKPIGLTSKFDLNGKLDIEYINYIDSLDNSEEIHKHIKKFFKHINKKLHYPPLCQENDIEGKVVVDFFINNNGNIIKLKIHESVHKRLDHEALKVVASYEKWPAPLYNGRSVAIWFRFPITFIL